MKKLQDYVKSLIDSKYLYLVIWGIGLALSMVLSNFYYSLESKKIEIKFKNEVNQFTASLHREFELNLESLHTLSSLFKLDKDPSYQEFIIESQFVQERNNSFLALEWIPWVKHEMRPSYEKKHQQQFPDFRFTERDSLNRLISAKIRDEYFPVYYVDPYLKNQNAFGYDLGSEKKRFSTLKSSQLSGKPNISGNIKLVQEKTNPEGCLAFLPIFKVNEFEKNDNSENLKGFVLGVFKFSKIFEATNNKNLSKEIDITLVSKINTIIKDTLFTYQSSIASRQKNIKHQYDLPLLWGKQWTIIASPTNLYIKNERTSYPLIILISGLIFTSLVVVFFHFSFKKNKQLTQVNAVKSKFLSLISHDVRGGVGSIDILLQLVLEDFESYDKAQLKEIMESIEENTKAIHLTLENLINWSKNDLLGFKPKKSLVNTIELFDNITHYFQSIIQLKALKFSTQYYTKDTFIYADKNMILASLRNIVSNAIKYTKKEGKIEIRLLQSNAKHIIEVEDSGIGMNPEELKKLFEYDTKHKSNGTAGESSMGIGLMITRDFLDMNNAKVQVESHIDKGTIFRIII